VVSLISMHPALRHSLLFRLGLALSLIAAMTLLEFLSSVTIAEKLRGAATAINHAGTLRYSTYAASTVALRPQVEDPVVYRAELDHALQRFERHYGGEPLRRVIPERAEHPARRAYEEIGMLWQYEVRPMILLAPAWDPDSTFYEELRFVVDDFVERVDRMVYLLERRTEAQVQMLRAVQAVALLLTLLVILSTVYFLRRDLVFPLRELLDGAESMRTGDFTRRIGHTGQDELGRLGAAFNRMAIDLSTVYSELEQRVCEKTRALESSNQSLELMYRSLSRLHDGTLSRANYTGTLCEMESLLGLGPGSLCLLERDGQKGFRLADSEHDPQFAGPLCERGSCMECVEASRDGPRLIDAADGSRVLTVPLHDGVEMHALLQMQVPSGVIPEPWQVQLVEAIGRHLGIAIAAQRRAIEARRLALLEERATIARELHDSLAQALSYLKIQVTRLQSAVRGRVRNGEVESVLDDLREGLNDAYAQLRELLTTFRIGLGGQGLGQALEETVAGIAAHGTLYIELDNRIADGQLGANDEVHLLQIMREALCNVQRHAGASRARVSLGWTPDGQVRLTVVDDGVGIGEAFRNGSEARPGHYGLTIMTERARQLGGRLDIGPGPDGGTLVELRFPPADLTGPAAHGHPASAREAV
jgi:two-component system, NarL family, nitrate/nitrite sensor histidine kinase NarX